jgi:Leucine-rich repeat (LRR) protein
MVLISVIVALSPLLWARLHWSDIPRSSPVGRWTPDDRAGKTGNRLHGVKNYNRVSLANDTRRDRVYGPSLEIVAEPRRWSDACVSRLDKFQLEPAVTAGTAERLGIAERLKNMHLYHFVRHYYVLSAARDKLRQRRPGRRLFMLALGAIPAGIIQQNLPASAMAAGAQCFVIETKNGLVTATFGDMVDDAALADAMPELIAQGVQSVVLRNLPVEDLSQLTKLAGLRALDVCGTRVRDIKVLASMTGLRSLNLQFLQIKDLTPLARLTGLQSLNVGGTEVEDLTPIKGLINLNTLVLAVTRVKDVRPLAQMTQMSMLDLDNTWVSNVRPLAGMIAMRQLRLNGSLVENVEALGAMTNLVELDLSATNVSDIGALAHLRNLRKLNLEGTQVETVAPLASLTGLRSVSLGGSLVSDMTPLAHLTELEISR